jgi:hypothetical protein
MVGDKPAPQSFFLLEKNLTFLSKLHKKSGPQAALIDEVRPQVSVARLLRHLSQLPGGEVPGDF